MVSHKRKNHGFSLEKRVRPRVEEESELEDMEASSQAPQSPGESDNDLSEGVSGSDGGDSDGVRACKSN